MLKKFFLNALSSFVGAWIAIVLLGAVLVAVCVGLVARVGTASVSPSLSRKSVMKISLSGVIAEAEETAAFDVRQLVMSDGERPQTLLTLTTALAEAKENKNIGALYIECGGVSAGSATLNALREAITDFKKSGKPVIAYADNYTQADYFVASAADSVFLNPQGMVNIHGIGGSVIYYKGLLDKLGMRFEVFKVGTYKSAVEPYIQETMSEPARAQLDTLYGVMWNTLRRQIAASRGLEAAQIDSLVDRDHISLRSAAFVRSSKLVDRLVYKHQIDDIMAGIMDVDKKKLAYIESSDVASQTDWGQAYSGRNQVAVLYATGAIEEGTDAGINCEALVPQIVKLADDDNVKAVVLRINSPGGSVFGTVQISEALRYLKSKDKPLVVSMGDYAASGGYWISCEGDRIYADALTITGSIGIFGLIPDASGLLHKLGLNAETVATNRGADFPNPLAPLDAEQGAALQKWINEGYDQFIAQVARGRKMPENKVRAVAEGRVWNAVTARSLGLVDEIGSLRDAIAYAVSQADLGENYEVAVYPLYEPSLWDFVPQLQRNITMRLGTMLPGTDEVLLSRVARILMQKPLQARMAEMTVRL